MTTRPINLRVRSGTGQCVLSDLTLESTLAELKRHVSLVMQIPAETLKLLHGFPPLPIDMHDTGKSLQMLNFRSGDTVIAQEDANLARPAATPRRAAALPSQPAQAMLTRDCVAANNSCLFTSIHFVLSGGELDLSCAQPMRECIASIVSRDPVKYNDVFLGRSNAEYCAWIRHADSWGGAIEVSILSEHHRLEMDVVDTQSLHISRFGEDCDYDERVLLIYDGIHYDPLKLDAFDSSAPPVTRFSTRDDDILRQALELAKEAKSSRQYTDMGNLSLRCLTCNTGLAGQVGAQQHAKQTGHTNFGEM